MICTAFTHLQYFHTSHTPSSLGVGPVAPTWRTADDDDDDDDDDDGHRSHDESQELQPVSFDHVRASELVMSSVIDIRKGPEVLGGKQKRETELNLERYVGLKRMEDEKEMEKEQGNAAAAAAAAASKKTFLGQTPPLSSRAQSSSHGKERSDSDSSTILDSQVNAATDNAIRAFAALGSPQAEFRPLYPLQSPPPSVVSLSSALGVPSTVMSKVSISIPVVLTIRGGQEGQHVLDHSFQTVMCIHPYIHMSWNPFCISLFVLIITFSESPQASSF